MPQVHAVILAGGSGTRFWPASRHLKPKQLLPLAGNVDETLIAATIRRIEPLVPPERIWISTGAHLVEATLAVVPNVSRDRVLAEPVARNTAACIGWATATIGKIDPQATIAVLPADHFIGNEPAFRNAISTALSVAQEGWITTIGIVPTRPETGYGYIEVGRPLRDGVCAVSRFVEKPTGDRAKEFVSGGRHLWNGGMFFFRADVMRAAIAEHLPAIASGLDRIEAAAAAHDEARAVAEIFPTFASISIDHGVMEKANRIAVVAGDFGWNDVGSWQVTWEMAAHDEAGNALPPGSIAIDTKNCLVRDLRSSGSSQTEEKGGSSQTEEKAASSQTEEKAASSQTEEKAASSQTKGKSESSSTGKNQHDKRWALVGMSDTIIVETDDAILVMPRDRAQDVRSVVDALTRRGENDKL